MDGIRNERERMNLPFGMSESDLVYYNQTLYDLYRNEGSGMDKDGFRYDPIVSTGMLASDYAYANGMAWVNYLTPESLASLNPGDNLIVPVNSYDNYKQLAPWEKRLSHEVSYTGNRVNKTFKNKSRMNSNSHFVGDFNHYFDNESRMVGEDTASPVGAAPTAAPASESTGGGRPTATEVIIPSQPVTPSRSVTAPPTTPKPVAQSPSAPKPTSKPASVDCQGLMNTYGIFQNAGAPWGNATQDVIDQWNTNDCSSQVVIPRPMSPEAYQAHLALASEDPNAEVIAEGDPAAMGGFGGGGGGGGGAEVPGETGERGQTAPQKIECDFNFIPVVIGIVIGLVIAYLIAKKKGKDVRTAGITGGVLGGILGFVYVKHQCSPIEVLNTMKVPSKANIPTVASPAATPPPAPTSSYYGGR